MRPFAIDANNFDAVCDTDDLLPMCYPINKDKVLISFLIPEDHSNICISTALTVHITSNDKLKDQR